MNNFIYSHPKYGWGQVVAAHKDDGAMRIFEPLAPDGDDGDWNNPLYYVKRDQLTLVSQDEWDAKFPEFERKFPTEEEERTYQETKDRALYEYLKKKFEKPAQDSDFEEVFATFKSFPPRTPMNKLSVFTQTLLDLKVGEHTVIRYAGDYVPSSSVYPRVSRISKKTGRIFERQRLSDTSFQIRRVA